MAYQYEIDQARDIGRIARALEKMIEGNIARINTIPTLDVRKLEKKVNELKF